MTSLRFIIQPPIACKLILVITVLLRVLRLWNSTVLPLPGRVQLHVTLYDVVDHGEAGVLVRVRQDILQTHQNGAVHFVERGLHLVMNHILNYLFNPGHKKVHMMWYILLFKAYGSFALASTLLAIIQTGIIFIIFVSFIMWLSCDSYYFTLLHVIYFSYFTINASIWNEIPTS